MTGVEHTKKTIRRRLRGAEAGVSPAMLLNGDEGAVRDADAAPTPAAVLVGIVDRQPEPTVLLTQRTEHLKDHSGQISFPGGRVEAHDEDFARTALREADEEVGLSPSRVQIVGSLATYHTVTGFLIHPVVGWVDPPLSFSPDPFEVEEVFEVPLGFVLDPANHRQESYVRGTMRRRFYVLPFGERRIWGATAGILVNLSRALAP